MTGLWSNVPRQGSAPYPHCTEQVGRIEPMRPVLAAMRRAMLGLVVMAWFCITPMVSAAPSNENSLEYAVKGAFLFKFGSFVEWPPTSFATSNAPLVIGIVGDDPFGTRLDQIVQGHTIEGRPVTIWRAPQSALLKETHILFISQSEKTHMGAIVASLQGKNMLTVAEFEHPAVIINFVIENNKVRFDVNLEQAERSAVKLSSKLLSVARVVKGK